MNTDNKKPDLYLATSLTHVPVEERSDIVELVKSLKQITNFLEWAFDVTTWLPKPFVDNIFAFDATIVTKLASFVAGVFWTSAGSDGRGAELYARATSLGKRGLGVYVREGVKVTPFITHMIRALGLNPVKTFRDIAELGDMILNDAISNPAPFEFIQKRDARVLSWQGGTNLLSFYGEELSLSK
jgi:hypothetical protein